MLSSAVDDIGVGSVLAVGGALVTLSVVGLSIYTLIIPPEGGGVFFGHILPCTDRSVLFGIELQLVLHSRSVFST